MCNEICTSNVRDAAEELAGIIGVGMTASAVRRLVRTHWGRIKVLAHQVHDEETSEERKLDIAIKNVAALSADGIREVIKGNAAKDVLDSFRLVAKQVERVQAKPVDYHE